MKKNSAEMKHLPIPSSYLDMVDEFKLPGETRREAFARVASAALKAAEAGIVPDAPKNRVRAAYLDASDLGKIQVAVWDATGGRKVRQGDLLIMGIEMAVEAKKRGLV